MKHFILTLFLFMVGNTLFAYDAVIDGIYYNFLGDEAEVTYKQITTTYPQYVSDYSGAVVIPKSVTYNGKTFAVTSIGIYAFCNCSKLTSVIIPESVTRIGAHSFEACKGLSSITIPEGITRIEDNTFAWCSSLETVSIPEGVTDIGFNAFYDCGSLEFINIPSSVNSIWGYAFVGCSSLTSFSFPEGVTWLCDYVLLMCNNLKTVTIPESVKTIGMGALAYCRNLNAINIPDSVEKIERNAFKECNSLTAITIPENVNDIFDGAFSGCTGLTSVICKSQVPTPCRSGAFDGVDKQSCKLYIPEGCEEAYRNAKEWKDFNIMEMGTGISEVKSEDYGDATYDLSGRKVNSQFSTFNSQFRKKGIYIQNGKKVAVK